MGKALIILLFFSLVLTSLQCYSQSSVKVSDPRLEMVGNKIQITYDILSGVPDGKYKISIVITDEAGNIIKANALDGDIGEEVLGGDNKQIIWDLEADNVLIDAYILVKVKAWAIAPPPPVIIESKEEVAEEDPEDLVGAPATYIQNAPRYQAYPRSRKKLPYWSLQANAYNMSGGS